MLALFPGVSGNWNRLLLLRIAISDPILPPSPQRRAASGRERFNEIAMFLNRVSTALNGISTGPLYNPRCCRWSGLARADRLFLLPARRRWRGAATAEVRAAPAGVRDRRLGARARRSALDPLRLGPG